ncbi:MAG: polyketide cyclase / dehydrase and lipid transport [Jatrophihabitans sp.]
MPDPKRPRIDIVDSTWVAARAVVVAAAVADATNWRRWWPALELHLDEDRNEKGARWTVCSVDTGRGARLAGTAEVWLEPMFEGVVAHFFLRLDPVPGTQLGRGERERITREIRVLTKKGFWALADRVDPGRMDRHAAASNASLP